MFVSGRTAGTVPRVADERARTGVRAVAPHAGITRRSLLRSAGAAGAAATGLGAGGCAGGGGVQVVVVWSGAELHQFKEVLGKYTTASGRRVEVVSAGDDIDAFIRARRQAGAAPDIAVLPRPGLVTEYASRGWLHPLDLSLAGAVPPYWSDLLTVCGELYGVWVKVAHKSLFWYRPALLDSVPTTWEELVATVGDYRSIHPGPVAPLAVGAADGWVVTDWFENVLAGRAPDLYDGLARGKRGWDDAPVRQSLADLADLWSIPGAFPGGGARALLTQFDESVILMTQGRAAMVSAADFAQTTMRKFPPDGGALVDFFRFPAVGDRLPLVVGGDAAVVLDKGGADVSAAMDLVSWLADGRHFASWIRAGGYLSPDLLSPHPSVPPERYPAAQPGSPTVASSQSLARQLRTADTVRFDLSDRLPGLFGGADGVGIWRILDNFFQAVTAQPTSPTVRGRAVAGTVTRLDAAAKAARKRDAATGHDHRGRCR